jgi:hypothetical protein
VLVGREAESTALARTPAAPGLAVLAGPLRTGKTALAEQAVGMAGLAPAHTGALGPLRHRPAIRTQRRVQTAWLDDGRDRTRSLAGALTGGGDLAGELAARTLAWCAADGGGPAPPAGPDGAGRPTLAVRSAGEATACRQPAGGWAAAMVGEQVHCLLALSTRRIAEPLGTTRHTTETYVKSGPAKLGVRTEAAVRAAVRAARPGGDIGPAIAPGRDPAEV